MRSERYQYSLIALGVACTGLFGIFFLREVFPEYKIYQKDYIALEEFRTSYTHEAAPSFHVGIKQILLEREDKGNPVIDRCISCHVALQFPHFSPTKIAYDVNGIPLVDAQGKPRLIPNEEYIWGKLDAKIAELTDEKVNAQLSESGDSKAVKNRLQEAEELKSLKIAHVDEHTYDVTKVLAMHPLIGKETRPFEFHPIEEYGCSSCHSGNGRGLTTEKAHGPVFDGDYEKEFVGHVPHFTEADPDNDPVFARVFNGKPGHNLLFQTSPILVGALIQSKCVQCHQTSAKALERAVDTAGMLAGKRQHQVDAVEKSLQSDIQALLILLAIDEKIKKIGIKDSSQALETYFQDYSLPLQERQHFAAQITYLKDISKRSSPNAKIDADIGDLIGSPKLVAELKAIWLPISNESEKKQTDAIESFLKSQRDSKEASGSLFAKLTTIDLDQEIKLHLKDIKNSFGDAIADSKAVASMASDVDLLTYNYQRGQQLFISQACYACHRIAGLARGGVGPELTLSGHTYPWFLKESIVWPQADLHTSTMPNYGLDHEELQDLVTFLLAQVGGNTQAISPTAYKTSMQEWEAGQKQAWEKPVSPLQMKDLRFSMTVFATEGCAACHRLEGYESNVGFSLETKKPSFDALYTEKQWFKRLIPEEVTGIDLVQAAEKNGGEIDQRIIENVRKDSILEEIEASYPQSLEALYTPFKFALRAKNAHFEKLIADAKDPSEKAEYNKQLQHWKDRIHRLMMVYIQEYGLGRIIGPRPNWSGVYHTDEWLMEHFRNPASHVPRSIMPIMPFDDSKFYALTHMLDVLGVRNRDAVRQIWENNGFNPELAYDIHCSQCHGPFLYGNGPVATWIYPIPKNLHNAEFLRNLTRDRAIESITHGVKGTPMAPWGEAADKPEVGGVPVLTKNEINKLVDWLFSSVPGTPTEDAVPKWKYSPQDFIHELENEGSIQEVIKDVSVERAPKVASLFIKEVFHLAGITNGNNLYAALNPVIPPVANSENDISKIFKSIPNPYSGTEKELYYIKEKYYTPENIEQGRLFFEMNCAVCHGKDADGSGMRAGAMIEAKPRMLTNLDWIKTRDDLRLLRSIKFGVAGTSMTPWGDFTSALQRMQLVMFIRSLTSQRGMQDELAEAIYAAFDNSEVTIERARINQYTGLDSARSEYHLLRSERMNLYSGSNAAKDHSKASLAVYQKEMDQFTKLQKLEISDSLYVDLRKQMKAEKDLYHSMGTQIIQNGDAEDLKSFIALIILLDQRIQLKENILSYQLSSEKESEITKIGQSIVEKLSLNLQKLKNEKAIIENKVSPQELHELSSRINSLTQLKNFLISGLAEGVRLRTKEKDIIKMISTDKDSKI